MADCSKCKYKPICDLRGYYSEGIDECCVIKNTNQLKYEVQRYEQNPEEYIRKYNEKRALESNRFINKSKFGRHFGQGAEEFCLEV